MKLLDLSFSTRIFFFFLSVKLRVLKYPGLFLKMSTSDGELDPLVGPSRPDHIVQIHKTSSSVSQSAVSLQGHIAILPAAKKWWAVSRLWFTGAIQEFTRKFRLFINEK